MDKDLRFLDRRTANVLLTILVFAVVLAVLFSARRILVMFFFAILFAYLIEPIVKFLQRRSLLFKNLRGPAVVEAYLILLVMIALMAHEVVPGLPPRTTQAFDEVQAFLADLSNGKTANELGDKYGWSDTQTARLNAFLGRHREDIQSVVRSGENYTSSAAQALAWLIVIPILAIFFLYDGRHIANAVIQLASPGGQREALQAIADEVDFTLRRYIRAKVILGSLSFIFYSATMLLLNFPHAMLLGLLGGFLEFVPVAGWMTSAAAILGVGALTHSRWVWMALLLGIWRLVQDYYNTPRIMGHELEIHPLMAIFAVMVGWEVGGIIAIYLLVPFIAIIRAVWRMRTPLTSGSDAAPELMRSEVSVSAN